MPHGALLPIARHREILVLAQEPLLVVEPRQRNTWKQGLRGEEVGIAIARITPDIHVPAASAIELLDEEIIFPLTDDHAPAPLQDPPEHEAEACLPSLERRQGPEGLCDGHHRWIAFLAGCLKSMCHIFEDKEPSFLEIETGFVNVFNLREVCLRFTRGRGCRRVDLCPLLFRSGVRAWWHKACRLEELLLTFRLHLGIRHSPMIARSLLRQSRNSNLFRLCSSFVSA